jgi:release factor glutamine methyltransferase
MTIGEWLPETTAVLQAAGIATARLDALVLLEDVTGMDRASLLAHLEQMLTPEQTAELNTFITQRKGHIPLAYIRGQAPFYGRNFYVSPAVLVPRPETEDIITELLEVAHSLPANPCVVDVGTGSGCIGITAKLELPSAQVVLLDIDQSALEVANKNASALGAGVTVRQADLLSDLKEKADVVLANLPYVPDDYPINTAATHEPSLALFSGKDGLDDYRTFWKQVGTLPYKPTHIIIEALPEQGEALRALAAAQTYKIAHAGDFVQHFVRSDL